MAGKQSQLGELLVELGLVDREQLWLALQQQRAFGGRLPRILAEKKLVDEDRLAKAVSAKLGLEAVNLSSLKIHERVLSIIPASVALKYGALPIAIKRTNQAEFVYVVMADPLDAEALTELQRVSGRQIRVLVAAASEIDRVLDQHYRTGSAKATAVDVPVAPQAAGHRPPQPGPAAQSLPQSPPIVQGQPLKNESPPPVRRAMAPPPQAPPPIPPVAPPGMQPSTAGSPQAHADGFGSGPPPLRSDGFGSSPPAARSDLSGSAVSRDVRSSQVGATARRPSLTPAHGTPSLPAMQQARAKAGGQSGVPSTATPPPMAFQSAFGAQQPSSPPPLQPSQPSAPGMVLPRSPRAPFSQAARPSTVPPPSASSMPRTIPPPLRPPESPQAALQSPPPSASQVRHASAQPAAAKTEALRIPQGEEDRTHIDPSTTFVDGGANLVTRDWDEAVRDWERSPSGPLPWPESDPERDKAGVLAAAAPQSYDPSEEPQEMEIEPVTSAAAIPEMGHMIDPEADVPKQDSEEIHIEILDATEGPEEIKTSQVDLSAELQGLGIPQKPIVRDEKLIAATLEVPIEVEDHPSPFEGPEAHEVPTGLERTGIIPAIDWDREEFIPPPLEKSREDQSLLESVDIPLSAAAVRARGGIADNKPTTTDLLPKREARDYLEDEDQLVLVSPTPDDAPQHEPERESAPAEAKTEPPRPSESKPDTLDMPRPERFSTDNVATPARPLSAIDVEGTDRGSDEDTLGEGDGQRAIDVLEPEIIAVTPRALQAADDSDSAKIPVIEPSSLRSLMDDSESGQSDSTGENAVPVRPRATNTPPPGAAPAPSPQTRLFDESDRRLKMRPSIEPKIEVEEDPTNPRIDTTPVRQALRREQEGFDELLSQAAEMAATQPPQPEEPTPPHDDVDRGKFLADLEGVVFGGPKTDGAGSKDLTRTDENLPPPRSESEPDPEARRMVEALLAGDSLNSAERAQLVLAIGRALVKKGILKAADLIDEL